jgi:hypothetical protein
VQGGPPDRFGSKEIIKMRFFASMGTLAIASLSLGAHAGIIDINEVRADQPGTDNDEFIELKGPPGQSMVGFTLLCLGDGTTTTKSGVVEWKYTFQPGDVIGPNGFLVLKGPGMTTPTDPQSAVITWPVGVDPAFPDNGLENTDTLTLLLVQGYSGTDTFQWRAPFVGGGSAGQDLDTNDNGELDVTPWSAVIDSVAIRQTTGTQPVGTNEWWYFPTSAGPYVSRYQEPQLTGGEVLAYWNQNSNGLTPPLTGFGFEVGDFPQRADGGTQGGSTGTAQLTVGGGALSATNAGTNVYTWLQSFGGSALGAIAPDVSGGSIAVQGGTVVQDTTANNGSYVQFSFSMAGKSGAALQFTTQRTSTGFNRNSISYSTDGTNFLPLVDAFDPPTAFAIRSFTAGAVLDNAQTAHFRLTLDGATGATGNIRLDNIKVTAGATVQNVTVETQAAPFYVAKTDAGAWLVGPAAPATGWDSPGRANNLPTYSCGGATSGDCSVQHDNPFCSDQCCCEQVCTADPFCCQVRWDSICATAAASCTGNCGGGCQTDLDADGATDGNDLGILLGAWGPGLSPADFNLDGAVDGNDLGIMLGAWGPCSGG